MAFILDERYGAGETISRAGHGRVLPARAEGGATTPVLAARGMVPGVRAGMEPIDPGVGISPSHALRRDLSTGWLSCTPGHGSVPAGHARRGTGHPCGDSSVSRNMSAFFPYSSGA